MQLSHSGVATFQPLKLTSSFAPETLIQGNYLEANSHTGRKFSKDRVFPVQMAELHGLWTRLILTTYIHWDDPPTAVDGRNPKANHRLDGAKTPVE